MIIIEKSNILKASEVEVMCICAPLGEDNTNGMVHFLKQFHPSVHEYHEIDRHKKSVGDVMVNYINRYRYIARLYSHTPMYEGGISHMCDFQAFEKSLEYIHEVYSDKIVGISMRNIIASGSKDHWSIIDYIISNVYGSHKDDAILKVFR